MYSGPMCLWVRKKKVIIYFSINFHSHKKLHFDGYLHFSVWWAYGVQEMDDEPHGKWAIANNR